MCISNTLIVNRNTIFPQELACLGPHRQHLCGYIYIVLYLYVCAKIYMHVKDLVVHVCESSVGYGNTRIYNVEGGQKEQYTHSHTLIQSTQTLLLNWPWLWQSTNRLPLLCSPTRPTSARLRTVSINRCKRRHICALET